MQKLPHQWQKRQLTQVIETWIQSPMFFAFATYFYFSWIIFSFLRFFCCWDRSTFQGFSRLQSNQKS
jgi:hypothetical protein